MTTISVAIPVLRGRTVFVFDKGRPWSVVEHIVLEALARREWTTSQLSGAANVSRRVIVEICIRLMRAGWVELGREVGVMTFRANKSGILAAKNSELPTILERKQRPISYIIELVSGNVFKPREWATRFEGELLERSKKEPLVWIQPKSIEVALDPAELVESLLEEDETFVGAEPAGITSRYVMAVVKDGAIEELPTGRDLMDLRSAILAAASQIPLPTKEASTTFGVPGPRTRAKQEVPEEHEVVFDVADLILDGDAHKKALEKVFAEARSKIIVHSTFVNDERFLAFLPNIKEAVDRGVRLHVFWGQNEETDEIVSTQLALSKLRANPMLFGLGDSLVLHPFSTGSHAKLIVADSGLDGSYIAIVGSCNWLTSGFASYEVSVLLRDPRIVAEVVTYLSRLSCIHDGVWSDLASEMIGIRQQISMTKPSFKSNARASIVIGAQHNHFVLRARDEATSRVFVASHRLGAVSRSSVIVPLMTAVEKGGIEASVFYCRRTSPLREWSEAKLVDVAAEGGVRVAPIKSPRLHAKVLAWDGNTILITSLNWLSADPIEMDSPKEIGVCIQANGVADALVRHFEEATN